MSHGRKIAASILDVYRAQHARAGYVLPQSVIAALSRRNGWSTDEVMNGIDYGHAEGWFTYGQQKFLTLTAHGFVQDTVPSGGS